MTAVRRLTAASRIAANASTRPCSSGGEGEVGEVMRCSLQVAHAMQNDVQRPHRARPVWQVGEWRPLYVAGPGQVPGGIC
ncbi:hypothetical protein D3C81_2071960 [compost metagenome]